jgi:hypothetical protein
MSLSRASPKRPARCVSIRHPPRDRNCARRTKTVLQKIAAKVRKEQPAACMKICALLVPREHKVEHTNSLSRLSDEQLDQAIEAIESMLTRQAARKRR